jgi:hypothetical protein
MPIGRQGNQGFKMDWESSRYPNRSVGIIKQRCSTPLFNHAVFGGNLFFMVATRDHWFISFYHKHY